MMCLRVGILQDTCGMFYIIEVLLWVYRKGAVWFEEDCEKAD